MPTPLAEWHRRLDSHFANLASTRAASGFPLFALEHGLSADEFADVEQLLRNSAPEDLPLGLHWLVWVVCAAEAGYSYTGGEYWPILAQYETQWLDSVNQRRLGEWFERFQKRYQGVKPSGTWAAHFKYIAWPITHAVLPAYLQEQLAKALFGLRYRLARLDDTSPGAIGRFLSENLWDAPSRLREFLQQEELAGRIVLALLNTDHASHLSPIYPSTLKRVLTDLERVHGAREWLKETQRYVAERFRAGGRTYGALPGKASPSFQANPREGDASGPLVSKARLLLRPSGANRWSVLAEIPSLAAIARQSPALREYVQRTRCKLTGVENGWRPGGWLLANSQRPRLDFWPKAGTPLARFEPSNDAFGRLTGDALRLTEGPIWVCRIGEDGQAHEITTRLVRPGRNYVLLRESALPTGYAHLRHCEIDCADVHAGLLSVPKLVTADDAKRLDELGVQVARTVRIQPAGLPARAWDGEGRSGWLTTEAPCFAIVHDHPIAGYQVQLDSEPVVSIAAGPVGSPVFVTLSPLRAGRHTLTVRIRRDSGASLPSTPGGDDVMTLDVREPEPWIAGTTAHAGMALTVEPNDPSLDAFLEGGVGVTVLGPLGRAVSAALVLHGVQGQELLRAEIGRFDLPLAADEWKRRLAPFLLDDERQWPFLEAASGKLLLRGEELGELRVTLERVVKPLRWLCRHSHSALTLRLIDDTGSEAPARIRFWGFARPAAPVDLSVETVVAGYDIDPPGGLYEAVTGQHADIIIASAPQIRGGFESLGPRPDLGDLRHGSAPVARLLELLRLWAAPRLAGPLVGVRRELVFREILNCLVGEIAGRSWAQAEAAFLNQSQSEAAGQQLQRAVGTSPGFLSLVRRDHERTMPVFSEGVVWFSEAATRYAVCTDRGLCDFALQMASRPQGLASLPAPVLEGMLKELRGRASLFRAARFAALLSAAKNPSAISGALPRWA
jgi:hypothetical protein